LISADIPALETLIFHVTQACNLKCRHCWQQADSGGEAVGKSGPEHGVAPEIFSRLLDEAGPLGLRGVKFTGGEPLLHPRFPEYLTAAAERRLSITVETNGTLIDEAMAGLLGYPKDMSISVSLDGSTPDIHDEFRGVRGAYHRTISGLKLLAGRGLSFQMITCLHRGNLSDLEAMVKLARECGARSMKINPVQPLGRGGDPDLGSHWLTVPELLALAGRWGHQTMAGLPGGITFSLPLAFRPLAVIREQKFAVCRIHHILALLPNGDLSFCGIGNIDASLVIGSIFKERLAEIWRRAPLIKALRQGLPHHLRGVCARCLLKAVCLGECRALAYEQSRDLMGPYWICQEAYETGFFPESRLIAEDTSGTYASQES
jgi:SynChlorMet cassette radical SAM/SPASM protein ScmF